MGERIIFERVTQEELDVPAYHISFHGLGHISLTLGTATEEVCKVEAPRLAREIKQREGIPWVAWEIRVL